jgi:hypothetical protein
MPAFGLGTDDGTAAARIRSHFRASAHNARDFLMPQGNSRCNYAAELTNFATCARNRIAADVPWRPTFVADRPLEFDQFGVRRQRPGDADALALPPGDFVRPAVQRVTRQAHGVDQRRKARREFGSRVGEAEIADRR